MKINLTIIVLSALYFGVFAQSEKIVLNYSDANFQKVRGQRNGLSTLQIVDKNASYFALAGEPNLPSYIINVAVPLNAEYEDVKVSFIEDVTERAVLVEHAQPSVPTLADYARNTQPVEANRAIYSSNSFFPKEKVVFTGEHKMNNYKFFGFIVSPYSYNPVSKEVKLAQNITLDVQYKQTGMRALNSRDDGTFYEMAKSMVVNPQSVDPILVRADIDKIKYLIITPSALKSSFLPLVEWKTRKGVKTSIITTEDILKNYDGATTQLKIKNCIKDYNTKEGTIYFMLAGDDVGVPDFNTYARVNGGEVAQDNTIPTDLFYATFDKAYDWNGNGNSQAGESTDNLDLAPEVIVTRASVNTAANATNFVKKLLKYEQNPAKTDFVNKMLLTGTKLWVETDEYYKTKRMYDTYLQNNWLPASEKKYDWFMSTKVQLSYDPSKTNSNYAFSYSNLVDVINRGYGFHHMSTHGNQQIWAVKSGYFDVDDVMSLTNKDKQGVVVTMACITNAFDKDGFDSYGVHYNKELCLSEAFLRNPNGGAVAYLGSSRFGWGVMSPIEAPGTSMNYNSAFFKNLFTGMPSDKKYKYGAVCALSKSQFIAGCTTGDGTVRWVMYTLNPLGDPEMDVLTSDPTEFNVKNIPNSVMIGNNSLTLNTGVSGAVACLYKDNDIYETYTADASGVISLNFNLVKTGILKLTVTAHNKIPIIKDILVDDGIPFSYKVEPAEISINIAPNQITNKSITITNTGGKAFDFNSSFAYVNPAVPVNEQVKQDDESAKPFGLVVDAAGGNVAQKFSAQLLSPYVGKMKIDKILVYLSNEPSQPSKVNSLKIRIWEANGDVPGKLLFEGEELVSKLTLKEYNEYRLPNQIELEAGKGYFVGYYIKATGYPIGLDMQKSKGNNYYDYYGDGNWDNLDNWYKDTSSNFKIRLGITNGLLDDNWLTIDNGVEGTVALNGVGEVKLNINSNSFKIGEKKEATVTISSFGKDDITVPVRLNFDPNSITDIETAAFTLYGNYPNPFNPQTEINYALANNGLVKLSVYNVKGEFIKELVNQNQLSGNHRITFDGTTLNSGIYFYKLENSGKVVVNKMVLVK